MKKNLWIWAIAALSMAACTSEDVPTTEQIVTENDWISPDGRVVVQLGAESTPAAVISRAPIEGSNITVLKELGIFAVNRTGSIAQSELTGWPNTINNILLLNVKAQGAEDPNEDGKEVDPLDKEVNKGKKLSLFDTEVTAPGAVYYYPMQGNQNFDFYGYQPRQEEVTINNGKAQVTISLNGDVDLITGKAEQAPQIDNLYETEAVEGTKPDMVLDPINGYNAKYIRKIKYHNWIIDESQNLSTEYQLDKNDKKPFIPNIKFGHRLTKLNFQIITAKEQAGEGNQGNDREEAKALRVHSIELKNVHTIAKLTIEPDMTLAYDGRPTDGTGMAMIKTNTDDNAIWADANTIIPQEYNEDPDHEYTTAGYLMVPATTAITDYDEFPYQIALTVVAKDETGVPHEQDIVLNFKSDNVFEAGKSYNIRIALYAQQEVHVSAELTPWDTDTEDVYIPVE